MKFGIFLSLFGLLTFVSCVNTPVTQEYMIISPKMVTFAKFADTTSSVSITHSCTCPFDWDSHIYDTSVHWIVFPQHIVGDQHSVPIKVVPSLMPNAVNTATITIVSNNYGTDSIIVTANR